MSTKRKETLEEIPEKITEHPESSAGFSCYIGPNLPGIIQTGTIYPLGRQDALQLPELRLALDKKPGIADLVVDGATLPANLKDVKHRGSTLYQAYQKLKKS